MPIATRPGAMSDQVVAPRNRKQLIGTRYFKQVIITWSIRNRGNVHRTHIMMNTRNHPLRRNTKTLITFPSIQPIVPNPNPFGSENNVVNSNGNPRLHPPRKGYKTIKKPAPEGDLGKREDMNLLLKRMM